MELKVNFVVFGKEAEACPPHIAPACSSCAHAKTRRGVYPFRICALDGEGRWGSCFCEDFTPSETAKWLAWE